MSNVTSIAPEPIKLQYGWLNEHKLEDAVNILAKAKGLPPTIAVRVGRLATCVRATYKNLREEYGKEVLTKFDPKKEGDALQKANLEFLKKEASFNNRKLRFTDVQNAGLSADDLMALEPFIDGFPKE